MSIYNYAKKLMTERVLVCEPRLLHDHIQHKLWAPDFMESVVFIIADKAHYQSALHFFWQSIFHQREVNNQRQAEEVISATHLHQVNLQQVHEKIKNCCPQWYDQYKSLIPQAQWQHITWDDEKDVFIIFEDQQRFYAWNWDAMV